MRRQIHLSSFVAHSSYISTYFWYLVLEKYLKSSQRMKKAKFYVSRYVEPTAQNLIHNLQKFLHVLQSLKESQ